MKKLLLLSLVGMILLVACTEVRQNAAVPAPVSYTDWDRAQRQMTFD